MAEEGGVPAKGTMTIKSLDVRVKVKRQQSYLCGALFYL